MDPWLDGLPEDWISQPRSSSPASLLNSTSSVLDRSSISNNNSISKIPRFRPRRKTTAACGHGNIPVLGSIREAAHDGNDNSRVLSERSFSEMNIPPQRAINQPLKLIDIERGRPLSRTVSVSTTRTTINHTLQRKSQSSSPQKGRQCHETLEWRRRLLSTDAGYGEQRDLFSPMSLEKIFQPPPPQRTSAPVIGRQEEVSYMPSSPPPYPSHIRSSAPDSPLVKGHDCKRKKDLGPLDEEEEDSVEGWCGSGNREHRSAKERDELEQALAGQKNGSSSFNPIATSTWRETRDNQRTSVFNMLHAEDDEECGRPPVTAYRVGSDTGMSDQGAIRKAGQRSVSGLDEERNEEISPIFISRHNTVDGRVGYAALSSPRRNNKREPGILITSGSDNSVMGASALPRSKDAKQAPPVDLDKHSGSTSQLFPDDLSTGTQDFVANGGFIGVRRGGYSEEGSFQLRHLSPSSIPLAEMSQLTEEGAYESSSGDELPQIRRLRPSMDESPGPPPAAPTPPVAPATPIQISRRKGGEVDASKSSRSPLKLFGNYDTFTNEKLLRRMSQLEDSFAQDESDEGSDISTGNHTQEIDEASLGYPGPHTILQEIPSQNLRNSSFGVGNPDNYEFQEPSFVSTQPDDYDEDGENKPPLPELRPGTHTSFPLPSALAGDDAEARLRGFIATTTQTSVTTEEKTRIQTTIGHQSTESPLRRRLSHSKTRAELRSGVGENNGRDAPYSPIKDRTPKRRRTLYKEESDGPDSNQAPKAATERSRQMQSIIGRKRKDARYDKESNKPVSPDVVAMRQILRPKTPTPSQARVRCRQAGKDASKSKSLSPRRRARQHENENGMETRVPTAVDIKTTVDESAAMGIGKSVVNESRKGSVTTQDFLDEALKVMDMIRSKGKLSSGLASVDESEADGERKLDQAQDQVVMCEDSTQEEFERPPSREYNTGSRRTAEMKHDARVVSHLRKFRDTTSSGDISASLECLNVLKSANAADHTLEHEEIESDPPNIRITENPSLQQRKRKHSSSSAQSLHGQPLNSGVQSQGSQSSSGSSSTRTQSIPTGSSTRSETLQVIPPHKVSHLIPGQVAGMVYDQTKNLWVKRKIVGDKYASEASEEDPFGEIPDLSVNEIEELARIKLAAAERRSGLEGTSIPPLGEDAPQLEQDYTEAESIGSGSPMSNREAEKLEEASSPQSKYSRLASSGPQPETRATSWGESIPDDSAQSHRHKHGGHASISEMNTREGHNEEVEHEIQVHEDRVEADINQSVNNQSRRGLHIAFSSPLVSLQHRNADTSPLSAAGIWDDASQLDHDDSGIDQFLELEYSSLSQQSSSRRASFGFPPRSAYRGAARRVSVGGRSFSARLFSRIDEQNEESVIISQRDNADRRASLGVTISTPMPLRDIPGSCSMPPPTTGLRTNVSFHLSPLPDFDLDPVGDAYALEVSYIAQRRGDVSLKSLECSFSLATEELVKRLTDVEPYEPYWEYIRQVDLREKGLITLHMLDDFCPRIEELDVSGNELGQLSGAPSSIRHLKITNNCLSNLTAWGHLTNLQYLDVSGNEIDNLLGFAGLKHLRELRADDNDIKSLEGVHGLDGLISLSVRNNSLEKVNFEKSELKRLSILDLRGNKIKDAQNLHCLAALTHLNLDDNSLQEFAIPKASPMRNLCSLKLAKNKLRTFDISCFPDLKILYLDHNQLGRVEGLQDAKRLDSVSMREQDRGSEDCASPNIDDCFEARKLYISGNMFPSFTPKMDFLNLQYLELASAGLTTLPLQFGNMAPNVRVLNLNFNALKDIRPLQGILRLKKLLLAGNRLVRLRKTTGVLTKFKSLSKVDLRNNPLTVGFHLAVTESRLVRGPNTHPHPDIDPFSLPMADVEKDASYRARLDMDTKLKRKVYEMLLGFGCPCLRELDGLVFDKDRVLERDETWERLKQLDIIRPVGNSDGAKENTNRGKPGEAAIAPESLCLAEGLLEETVGKGTADKAETEEPARRVVTLGKETADKVEPVVNPEVEGSARGDTTLEKETIDKEEPILDAGGDGVTEGSVSPLENQDAAPTSTSGDGR
ncbi:hypothetical protein FGG08_006728 [Glutinoglossum americanum]|uniref:Septation initiation network scaffold protein cdc11 n=1 Tax=Glutinoglossum americanum TaxID=1670608 RepID=A0A9P8I0A5_9PEZI|nr:hypothetical protein FGG08_006728 [Glutinoglossum americanum]